MTDEIKVDTEYGVDQVDSLEGLEAVQKRPGMYIGSTSQRGINHLIFETIDNSVDEFVAGYGDEIYLQVSKGGKIRVEDHGRGMPVGPHPKLKNSDGTPIDTLTALLTKLHTGGKFGNGGYKVSGGLHGIGVKAVNALSETFFVISKRESKIRGQKFSHGKPITEVLEISDCNANDTGTIIEYIPSKLTFKQTIEPSDAVIQSRLDEIVSLNGGLKIHYKNEINNIDKVFYQKDGIKGYTKRMVEDKPLLFEDVIYISDKYKISEDKIIIVEIAFIYDNDDKPHETFKCFANNINTYEGGYHLQGFRDAYKKCMNEYITKNNICKDNVELRYLMDGIYAIISIKIPEAEFEGQTKTKLGNEEAETAVEAIIEKNFPDIIKNRSKDIELIVERAIKVKQAEEAARKARQLARASSKLKKDALPGKLRDCENVDGTGYSEIILCEGDSAGGCVTQGRNRKFQAVLPLKGKVLNTEKSDLEKMLKSEAIRDITVAIGTGIGAKFNIKDVRYDKIIIMTDADDDGMHIRTLLLTYIYKYMRPLLEKGYVYSAKPPLFRVILKNKDYKYVLTDNDLKDYKKANGNKIVDVQRFKGLGEMNPEELKETVLDPTKRILERITLNDAIEASKTFEMLMGKDVASRRIFIEENAHLVSLDLL